MAFADTAYGSAPNLAWLVKDKKITPHIPVSTNPTAPMATFSRADFTFDADANHYVCPADKLLVQFRRSYDKPRSGITKAGTKLYRASKKDCSVCDLKPKCCPNMVARKSRAMSTRMHVMSPVPGRDAGIRACPAPA